MIATRAFNLESATFVTVTEARMVALQKRHRADDETNRRKVQVLRADRWQATRWEHLQVGDICKVLNNQFFPADLILLASRSVHTCTP